MIENIKWLGHASFKFLGEKIIYIDPVDISDTQKADIIIATHSHHDHFSVQDISKLTSPETNILITPDCQSKLRDVEGKITILEPNKKYNVKGILIETFPAYNTNKPYHPRENDWLGLILTLNNQKILYAGDTDVTPELKEIKSDIALVPVSGVYVMSSKEAADYVNSTMPKLAIPYHYGSIVGTLKDAEEFKSLSKAPVHILTKE